MADVVNREKVSGLIFPAWSLARELSDHRGALQSAKALMANDSASTSVLLSQITPISARVRSSGNVQRSCRATPEMMAALTTHRGRPSELPIKLATATYREAR
ncbi:hypothetical protein MRX96_047079 [Rhipicephalus microplus]